jgi:hypothetical protein
VTIGQNNVENSNIDLNFVMFTDHNCTHRVSGKLLSEKKKLAKTAVNAILAVQSRWPGWDNERLGRFNSGFKGPDKRAWIRWTMYVAEFGMKTPTRAAEPESDFECGMEAAVENLDDIVDQQQQNERDEFADSPVRTSKKTPKKTGKKSKGIKPKYHNTGKQLNIDPLTWNTNYCPKVCVVHWCMLRLM